jgi:general secretion pathway protein I
MWILNNSISRPRAGDIVLFKRGENRIRSAPGGLPACLYSVLSLRSRLGVLNPDWKRKKVPWNRAGFTLLEVMVAVAILAISMATLFGSQSQSLVLATEAKFNTNASLLAGLKLAELESGRIEPVDDEGNFGADFPEYKWKMAAREPSADASEGFDLTQGNLFQIDLTVFRGGDSSYLYTARCYIRKRGAL